MSPISATPAALSGLDLLSRTPRLAPAELLPAEKAGAVSGTPPATDSFANMLGKLVSDVNAQQQAAGGTVAALQAGQNVPLHQAVLAMEEANVSFSLMVEVRNKLLESYQEIMKMQV